MTKAYLAAALGLSLGLASISAQAASVSITTGRADLDESGYDPATVASVRVGTQILDAGLFDLDAGVEAATDIDAGETADGEEWNFRSLGGYLSGRTAGPLYLIGRLGLARQQIEIDGDSNTATQRSAGIGVGASTGVVRLELMATRYASEDDLSDITWLSAGISF
ncbi:MAG: hypothetical protein WD382_05660 [Halofilum sp. (in: g-proteobacteria)]